MTIQDSVLQILACERKDGISGEEMASDLGVSRASIWKAIQRLQEGGYRIEAVRNKGYRMVGEHDPLTERGIRSHLAHKEQRDVELLLFDTIDSTNAHLKQLAKEDAAEYTCVISNSQTKGRGRRGRDFCSPSDTGIYLSILIRQNIPLDQTGLVTGAAAVAVCRAIEATIGKRPEIKWVNDVYLNGRKVCGILTEGAADLETGTLAYAIIGIGINVYEPSEGWPEEIAMRAGCLRDGVSPDLKNRLVAKVIEECIDLTIESAIKDTVKDYQDYSMMKNRQIVVRFDNGEEANAISLGVNDDLNLRVRYENNSEETLSTGEVSITV